MIANRSALIPFVDHRHHVPYAKFDLYESYGMSNEIPSYSSHSITSLNSSKRHMPIKILLMEALAKGTMSKKRILKKTFTYSVSGTKPKESLSKAIITALRKQAQRS